MPGWAAGRRHLQAVLLQLLDVGEALLLELREEVQSTLLVGADTPSTGSGVRTATCAAGCNFSFGKEVRSFVATGRTYRTLSDMIGHLLRESSAQMAATFAPGLIAVDHFTVLNFHGQVTGSLPQTYY